jgi:hypothetical protein
VVGEGERYAARSFDERKLEGVVTETEEEEVVFEQDGIRC